MKARFVASLLAAGALLLSAATASAAPAPVGSTGKVTVKNAAVYVWCTFQGEKPFQLTHNEGLITQGHYTGCDRTRATLSVWTEPPLKDGGGACRAPAAWWCARTDVESSETSQSISPAVSASAWIRRRSISHVPSADHRRWRSCTVFHGPNRSGTSRHCTPVRIRYSTPFTT